MLIPEFKTFTWVPDGQHAPPNARLVPRMLQTDCHSAQAPAWPVSLHPPVMPAPQADSPPAEKHAWTMFAAGFADMDSLWFLSTLLPAESFRPFPQGSASWLTGTQSSHGKCSPRPEVQEYPWCSHLLAQVFQALAPNCVCTTLALFRELQAPLHRDSMNASEFYNVLVPLSTFQQGQVWVHHASGPALCPDASSQHRGILLDVAFGPQLLDAACLHCTLPWQGRRLLLVGFTLKGWQDLSLAARSRLAAFPLPDAQHTSAMSPPRNILQGHEAGPGGSLYMCQSSPCRGSAWGVHFTMKEHVAEAMKLDHPADTANPIPDSLKKAVFALATKGYVQTDKDRRCKLEELKEISAKLNDGVLEPGVKNLKLFRHLVQLTGFKDSSVCESLENGVVMVGPEPESGIYAKRPKPMLLTPQQLDEQAAFRRKATISSLSPPASEEENEVLFGETDDEVSRGFLEGPFDSEAEMTERLGTDAWSPSSRFVIFQGEERKQRVIDNLRDSGINACFGSSSYLSTHDTDFLSALYLFISDVWSNKNSVIIKLADGSVLEGKWHADFGLQECNWVGRCFDLSKAYKQVPVNKESLKHTVLVTMDIKRKVRFYLSRVLPFGGNASVFSFCKISRAIWHMFVELFGILTAVYVDDFPAIGQSTSEVITGFLDLIGWSYASGGSKAPDFSTTWIALGVQWDFSCLGSGSFRSGNKPGRLERICAMAKLVSDIESPGEAARLSSCIHGMLNFAGGFVLGHALKPATRMFSDISCGRIAHGSAFIKHGCNMVHQVASFAKPRILSSADSRKPIILYTDGSYEDSVGRWGAFLIDCEDGSSHVLQGTVPPRLTERWVQLVGKQVICEIELFAYCCARVFFSEILESRRSIVFIDNESCRISLVKGTSKS